MSTTLRVLSFKNLIRCPTQRRYDSVLIRKKSGTAGIPQSMSVWQINDYNGIESLQLVDGVKLPPLTQSSDVLIEVKAASINVLDVMMTEGYGQQLFEKFNIVSPCKPSLLKTSYLPLTLGRDFSGVVCSVGGNVTKFKPGDEVMGVVPPPLSGSHSEYLVTSHSNLALKPPNLSVEEAASIPYAGLTAWAALSITGELCLASKGKQVLVLGASGGVGSNAVQLLKSWRCMVVATCSSDAASLVESLGCDFVVDYSLSDAETQLQQFGGFDVILDCTGRSDGFSTHLLKPWSNAKYVTLSPPTLRNFDENGLVGGFLKSGIDLLKANSSSVFEGKTLRWGYFVPNSMALSSLRDLALSGSLRPVIDSVHKFEKLPEAYDKLKAGHSRGKIVVRI